MNFKFSKVSEVIAIIRRQYKSWIIAILLLICGFLLYRSFFLIYNPYPAIDISRNFIDQENFIVNIQPLRDYLNDIQTQYPKSQVSIYFEFLNTGANIAVNKDTRIWPASLPKVPVASIIMKKVESGQLHLGDQVTIQQSDLDTHSGILYTLGAGFQISINDLLTQMLVNSDNTADHALLRLITADDEQGLISDNGVNELFNAQGLVSAKEYAQFFKSLYESSYLDERDSEKILDLLSRSTYTSFMSEGLPTGVRFARKWGIDLIHSSYLEAGIVYVPQRPYLLVVMFGNTDEDTAKKLFKDISQHAYQYVSTY